MSTERTTEIMSALVHKTYIIKKILYRKVSP